MFVNWGGGLSGRTLTISTATPCWKITDKKIPSKSLSNKLDKYSIYTLIAKIATLENSSWRTLHFLTIIPTNEVLVSQNFFYKFSLCTIVFSHILLSHIKLASGLMALISFDWFVELSWRYIFTQNPKKHPRVDREKKKKFTWEYEWYL